MVFGETGAQPGVFRPPLGNPSQVLCRLALVAGVEYLVKAICVFARSLPVERAQKVAVEGAFFEFQPAGLAFQSVQCLPVVCQAFVGRLGTRCEGPAMRPNGVHHLRQRLALRAFRDDSDEVLGHRDQ